MGEISSDKIISIGLIVNPLAGIGGSVGLSGSDGIEIVKEAFARGATQEAPKRAEAALRELAPIKNQVRVITAQGDMGLKEALNAGFEAEEAYTPKEGLTTEKDTEAAATAILGRGVSLLLFAGGDGTARNVCSAVGERVTVIGIPAGVKIHSAVYGISPAGAGQTALSFLRGEVKETKSAEVMDLDEELYRKGIVSPKLYGYMNVPASRRGMQNVKARSTSAAVALDCIATDIIQDMEEDICYIIGAGTTTRNIMGILKLENTLIGIDVVKNKKLLAGNVSEKELWEIVKANPCRIVVTAIGGQGHIFGRGNQQISPRIIQKVGKDNITVIATKEKLLSLSGRRLMLDTGDDRLDKELSGYMRVVTGLGERVICPIGI